MQNTFYVKDRVLDNFHIISTMKGLEKYRIVVNTAVILQETHFRLSEGSMVSCWKEKKGKLYALSLYCEAEVNLVLSWAESNRFRLWLGVRKGKAGQARNMLVMRDEGSQKHGRVSRVGLI